MASSSKDITASAKSATDPRSPTLAPPQGSADPATPAGRIVHDERGNAVWNWSNQNNQVSIGSTSQMLKQLNLTSLSVEGEAPPDEEPEVKPRGSGYGPGYDPYDRTAPVRSPPPAKATKG